MTDNRIAKIADHYGLDLQLIQCASELNELGAEVTRLRLAKDMKETMKALAILPNLVEEIADVEIMCQQIKYLLDCNTAVENTKERKLQRQLERMGKKNDGQKD